MKCHLHNLEDAVGTCNDCRVGICSTCNSLFEPQLCLRCGNKINKEEKLRAIMTLVSPFFLIPILGFVICFIISGGASSLPIYKILKSGLGALVVGHGVYFLASKKKPKTFGESVGNVIIAPFVVLGIFILSPWVGMIALPWKMFRSFKFLSDLKQGDEDRVAILEQFNQNSQENDIFQEQQFENELLQANFSKTLH